MLHSACNSLRPPTVSGQRHSQPALCQITDVLTCCMHAERKVPRELVVCRPIHDRRGSSQRRIKLCRARRHVAALSRGRTHLREYAVVGGSSVDPVVGLAHRRQPVRRRHGVQILAAAAGAAAARVPAVQPVRLEVPRVITRLQIETSTLMRAKAPSLQLHSPRRCAFAEERV